MMRCIILLVSFASFGQTITLSDSDVKAFYGALGHGADANGGRGYGVYQVTSLADDGSGGTTLREAVDAAEAAGGGYIIFRIGGDITLTTDLRVENPNIYIAGQTAPGSGIALRSHGLMLLDNDLVVRHIRVRPGPSSANDAIQVGINGSTVYDVYVDHCSSAMGYDENISVANAFRVTIANCISGDNQGSGSYLINAQTAGGIDSISYIKNLSVWNTYRNPRVGETAKLEFINNMGYGSIVQMQASYGSTIDVVGNVWENDTDGGSHEHIDAVNDGEPSGNTTSHVSDNIFEGSAATVDAVITANETGSRNIPSSYTPMSSDVVKNIVLTTSGAGRGVQGLDSYDTGLISDVNAGTASNYGGNSVPTLSTSTAAYTDSDGDGLSDEYETANGGSAPTWSVSPSTRPANATLVSGITIDQSGVTSYATTGYTHMDIFLGELAGDWTGGSGGGGGGTTTPNALKNATNAMLIAH